MKTRSKSRRTADEWSRLVAAWRQSGQNSKVFAELYGLNRGTLLYWSYRLAKASNPASAKEKGPAQAAGFLPVQVMDEPASVPEPEGISLDSGSLEVVTRCGRVIRCSGAVDVNALRTMLQAVESC